MNTLFKKLILFIVIFTVSIQVNQNTYINALTDTEEIRALETEKSKLEAVANNKLKFALLYKSDFYNLGNKPSKIKPVIHSVSSIGERSPPV